MDERTSLTVDVSQLRCALTDATGLSADDRCLSEFVDPDALETLFDSRRSDVGRFGSVSFPVDDRVVVLDFGADEAVDVSVVPLGAYEDADPHPATGSERSDDGRPRSDAGAGD